MAPISNQPKCNTLGVVKVLANIIFGPDGNTVERQLSELLSDCIKQVIVLLEDIIFCCNSVIINIIICFIISEQIL